MKSAVLRIKGKQYWVSEGDEVLVHRLSEGERVEPQVLLLVDGNKVALGKPLVRNVNIDCTVLGSVRGDRIQVFKYKAKSRYRKRKGFKPLLTRVRISKISF